jgi:hypothetical protein
MITLLSLDLLNRNVKVKRATAACRLAALFELVGNGFIPIV